MSERTTDTVDVDRNELLYLYYAFEASQSEAALENADLAIDVLVIQERAQALITRVLGLPGLPERLVLALSALPSLPEPGTTTSNPLLPEPVVPEPHAVGRIAGVVYGLIERFGGFAFLDETSADAWAREVEEVNACTTLGDFRRLVPQLEHVTSPVDPTDDEYPFLPDGHGIDLDQYFDSWPPNTPLYGQELLPDDVVHELIEHSDAHLYCTILDGDFFFVPTEREGEMLAVFARHGLTARRDDSVVACLDV